jgi:hypothetical protein
MNHEIIFPSFFIVFLVLICGCMDINSTKYNVKVEIISPAMNENINGWHWINVTFDPNAPDTPDMRATRAEYYLDGKMIDSVTIWVDRPLSMGNLDTTKYSNGEHIIKVIGYWNGAQENGGKGSIKASVEIKVFFNN